MRKKYFALLIAIAWLAIGCGTQTSCTVVTSGKAGRYFYQYEKCHSISVFRSNSYTVLRLFKKRLIGGYKTLGFCSYEIDSFNCSLLVVPGPDKNSDKRIRINWCTQTVQKLNGYKKRDTLISQVLRGSWHITNTIHLLGESVEKNGFFDNPRHFNLVYGNPGSNVLSDSSFFLPVNDCLVKDSMLIIKNSGLRFKVKTLTKNELVLQEYINRKGSTQYVPGYLVGYFKRRE